MEGGGQKMRYELRHAAEVLQNYTYCENRSLEAKFTLSLLGHDAGQGFRTYKRRVIIVAGIHGSDKFNADQQCYKSFLPRLRHFTLQVARMKLYTRESSHAHSCFHFRCRSDYLTYLYMRSLYQTGQNNSNLSVAYITEENANDLFYNPISQ